MMRRAGFSTISELAEHSGVSVKTIYNLQYGVHTPNHSTLKLLAQSLEVGQSQVEDVLG
jgi:transcriptional regulator with XRE-family HTH domain